MAKNNLLSGSTIQVQKTLNHLTQQHSNGTSHVVIGGHLNALCCFSIKKRVDMLGELTTYLLQKIKSICSNLCFFSVYGSIFPEPSLKFFVAKSGKYNAVLLFFNPPSVYFAVVHREASSMHFLGLEFGHRVPQPA